MRRVWSMKKFDVVGMWLLYAVLLSSMCVIAAFVFATSSDFGWPTGRAVGPFLVCGVLAAWLLLLRGAKKRDITSPRRSRVVHWVLAMIASLGLVFLEASLVWVLRLM